MVTRFRIGRCVFAAIALAIMCFGFATPAMADGETPYKPSEAMLTMVIVAPEGTDTTDDTYVIHFAGGGLVTAGADDGHGTIPVYSGVEHIEQDNTTIKAGDTVPPISDLELHGTTLTANNSLTKDQTCQTVIQMSLSEILAGVDFPHAGVYTYVVTETSATMANTDGLITASKAEYVLRIRVSNDYSNLTSTNLTIESVTVERTKDDDGKPASGKVDPEYPKATNGKITEEDSSRSSGTNELAGDEHGLNVSGFTFANKYIMGGPFQVKQLYTGDHTDRTKYSPVELRIYSASAEQGGCLTYRIVDGEDLTTSNLNGEEHSKLNGVYDIDQANDFMVEFDNNGCACIQAGLKEGSVILITGEFGPVDSAYASQAPNKKDTRKTLTTRGPLEGHEYYVVVREPHDYRPTGYVYYGNDPNADPRDSAAGMTRVNNVGDDDIDDLEDPTGVGSYVHAFELFVPGETIGSDTTVFVVTNIDELKVSVTGILIDNLPYVLMIGIPVAVFIALFALKRRRNAVE